MGKHQKINKRVLRILINTFTEKNKLDWCEIRLPGCQGMGMDFCHRHGRNWYYKFGRSDDEIVELMSSYKQVVRGCRSCHNKIDTPEIEKGYELREKIFLFLRGEEDEGIC